MNNRHHTLTGFALLVSSFCTITGIVSAAGESWLRANLAFYDTGGDSPIIHHSSWTPDYFVECYLDGQEPPVLLSSGLANPDLLVSNDLPILFRAFLDDGRVYAFYEDVRIPELYFCVPLDFAAVGGTVEIGNTGLAPGVSPGGKATINPGSYVCDEISSGTWGTHDVNLLGERAGAPSMVHYTIVYLEGNSLEAEPPDEITFNTVIPTQGGYSVGHATLVFGDTVHSAGAVDERKIYVRPELPLGPVRVAVSMDGYQEFEVTFELQSDRGHWFTKLVTPAVGPDGYLGPADIESDLVILPIPDHILQRAIAWDLNGEVDDFMNLEKHMYPGIGRVKDVGSLIAVASR